MLMSIGDQGLSGSEEPEPEPVHDGAASDMSRTLRLV